MLLPIISSPIYTANGVYFDGANDYLSRGADYTSIANSKTFTFSFWCKRDSAGSAEYIYDDPAGGLSVGFAAQSFQVRGTDAGGTQRLVVDLASAIADTEWHHIIISCNMSSTSNRHIYIDGVDKTGTASWSNYQDATIAFSKANHYIMGASSATASFAGDVADLWFTTAYVDLSISSNLRRFLTTTAKPVDLGGTGIYPTGSQPILYLSRRDNMASSFVSNKGSGGGFTLTGSLTNSSTGPSS